MPGGARSERKQAARIDAVGVPRNAGWGGRPRTSRHRTEATGGETCTENRELSSSRSDYAPDGLRLVPRHAYESGPACSARGAVRPVPAGSAGSCVPGSGSPMDVDAWLLSVGWRWERRSVWTRIANYRDLRTPPSSHRHRQAYSGLRAGRLCYFVDASQRSEAVLAVSSGGRAR